MLVLEPPLPAGQLKTARKGVGRFTLEVDGRAAHAGVEPEKGDQRGRRAGPPDPRRSNALADPGLGTTVNVGVIQGGTTPNVVPAEATAAVDVRAIDPDRGRARSTPRCSGSRRSCPVPASSVSGGFNRPPMERTPAVAPLFERAARSADRSASISARARPAAAATATSPPRSASPPSTAWAPRSRGPCRSRAHRDRVASPACGLAGRAPAELMIRSDLRSPRRRYRISFRPRPE